MREQLDFTVPPMYGNFNRSRGEMFSALHHLTYKQEWCRGPVSEGLSDIKDICRSGKKGDVVHSSSNVTLWANYLYPVDVD